MRKIFFALLVSFALVATSLPAGATPPSNTEMVVATSLLGDPGPFMAGGAGVDDGIICESGEVVDLFGKVTGNSPTGFNFQGVKQFVCDDGSGTFDINIRARIDFRKGVAFHWNVLRGSGDYVDLHGAGDGFGIPGAPCGDPGECVLDVYSGGLHID